MLKRKFVIYNWVYFFFISSFSQSIFIAQLSHLLSISLYGVLLWLADIIMIYLVGYLLVKKWEISNDGIIITFPFRFIKRKIIVDYQDINKIRYKVVGKYSDVLKISTTFGTYSIDIPNITDNNKITSFFSLMKEKNIYYIIKGGWKIYDENPPSLEYMKQIEKEELKKKRLDFLNSRRKNK